MYEPSPALRRDMESKGIDVGLSLSILEDYNAGLYDQVRPVRAAGVPELDGRRVVAVGEGLSYEVDRREAAARLGSLGLELPGGLPESGGRLRLDRSRLEELGLSLLGRTAFGVLNGGSATSYADRKKNQAFGSEVFAVLEGPFEAMAPLCADRPKGLAPAYLNPDGSPGASFLLLKMRARLLLALRATARATACATACATARGPGFMPLFQMSSAGNDAQLAAAYAEYGRDPLLATLAERTGLEPATWMTGVQPMICAYSHSAEGRPKRIFDRAHGRPDSALPLPGGHGQCFRVLADTLRALRDSGIRFAYLGNVDNLGFLPDPVEVALLALSGLPAGFDFARRTPVDVKGGILVETEEGGRTVADIGPAIAFEEVRRLEAGGASILFNCATGLFDLDWLVPRLDEVGRRLPVRFSDQDKDAGRYSQAEQVTWEVTGLLPDFLAFAVDKYERFIAAKLLAETLLTSGVGTGAAGPGGRADPRIPAELAETSRRLCAGLERKLAGDYGLELSGGRWVARELRAEAGAPPEGTGLPGPRRP